MTMKHPVLLYIHSTSVTTTCSRSEHIFFPFYFIPNRFHTFTAQHTEEKKNIVVPKALFLKWNFMSVIVEFHSITGWCRIERRGKREGKSPVEMWWWKKKKIVASNYEAFFFLSSLFLCKKFLWKKNVSRFCFVLKLFFSFFFFCSLTLSLRSNTFRAKILRDLN